MADVVRSRGRIRRVLATACLGPVLLGASGCSLFGDDDSDQTSVFDAKPGMCFTQPDDVEAELSDIDEVDCGEAHQQEAYAVLSYAPPDGESDEYPGEEQLTAFADGACATAFSDYVGIDYLDSGLFFTYLLPSPRSWDEDDREVLCLITANGEDLTASVKGSKR